jgi:hypothetical protein
MSWKGSASISPVATYFIAAAAAAAISCLLRLFVVFLSLPSKLPNCLELPAPKGKGGAGWKCPHISLLNLSKVDLILNIRFLNHDQILFKAYLILDIRFLNHFINVITLTKADLIIQLNLL